MINVVLFKYVEVNRVQSKKKIINKAVNWVPAEKNEVVNWDFIENYGVVSWSQIKIKHSGLVLSKRSNSLRALLKNTDSGRWEVHENLYILMSQYPVGCSQTV